MQTRERREFQRLLLPDGVPARFGDDGVRLLEIGVSGARFEHDGREPVGRTSPLRFEWEGEAISLEVEVIRSSPAADHRDGRLHHVGVLFLGADEASADALRRALSAAVLRRLDERKPDSSAAGEPLDFDDTLRPGDAMFLSYVFENGVWKKRRAFLPEQPEVGFTVAFDADKDELQRLCRAYEQADLEGRRLLRLFCELSISDAMNVPRKR
ncbi:MAG TPA: PilZ domain-containing protein [Thermoanaerobaculia bacterium]|nr:PilZ domain-containing protein [Thermoanaerobaculia bacterium]